MTTKEISNSDDIIDSRDVIARIEELKALNDPEERAREAAESEGWVLHESNADSTIFWFRNKNWKVDFTHQCDGWASLCDAFGIDVESCEDDELNKLKSFHDSFKFYTTSSPLIHKSYFPDYLKQEFEESVGSFRSREWPFNCIDWEVAAVKKHSEYNQADFDGVTYLYL